jgi:serine/threonine protein kinase
VRIFGRTLTASRDRERFEAEAAALIALADVPYVLPLLDAGVAPGGHAYVVMPQCLAGSLQDHVDTMGRMSPVEVRRVGVKLSAALSEVHRRGVVHRNITPSNVLIDRTGEPALADFGIVALSLSGGFRPEPWRGHPPFLAPEAYLPELMSPAADIYALGATLYALLAGIGPPAANLGQLPLTGEDLPDLPRVPWPLMTALCQAMALDPRDRFSGSSAFRTALAST